MIKLSEMPQAAAKGLPREFLYWLQESFTRINNKLDLLTTAVAGNVVVVASDNDVEDSGMAAPTGDFVGTTDTQTLTNKTLVTPTIADFTNAQHDHQDADDGGKLDHGAALNGLADDDHSGYPWLAGRATGQTLNGGTASGEDLKLISTAHATKGSVYIGGDGGTTNYSEFESDGTLKFIGSATVWDDIRINPGSFDRPGVSDPSLVVYNVNGGGVNTYLYEFEKNDIASFTVQIPHSYQAGENIYVHIHWTPGSNGATESGKTVGWKIDYSWASIDGNFGTMATLDLSDTCDGTDHKHQMTPDASITGTGKGISSMLLCNIKRTDTGTDDTWAGTASGALPMLLEIDFHFPIDTVGSRDRTSK